jgi:hypothetical protein
LMLTNSKILWSIYKLMKIIIKVLNHIKDLIQRQVKMACTMKNIYKAYMVISISTSKALANVWIADSRANVHMSHHLAIN